MSRMLFLRDIQVDIQMRCRGCGHEGVLARRDLERRFGPNYPVLSIAPHYRCSRCGSKEVESGPAPNAGASFTAGPGADDARKGAGGAMGVLEGLLASVRGERAVHDARNVPMDVEEPPPPPAPPPADEDDFDALLAKLAPPRRDTVEPEDEAPEDLAPEGDAPEDRTPAVAEPDAPPAPAAEEQSPFDETLAALRALTSDLYEEDEEDEPAEEIEDLDEIPDEEIVSFAIRDPDLRSDPDDLPPGDADIGEDAEDEDAEDEDAEDEDAEDEDGEDEREVEPFSTFRRPPPAPGSLDESLAALRALVEKAAANEPEPRRDERPEEPDPDEAVPEEPAEEEPPVLKTSQERSLEETLAQLRGMLDLDKDPDDDAKPVVKPRKR